MEYRKAAKEQAEEIYQLVQNTIRQVYVLVANQCLLETGSRKTDHITRIFVSPEYHGRGYGGYIMQKLEDEIALNYRTVNLDASLPANGLNETRGYWTVRHDKLVVGNGAVLVYEIMEKELW